ELQIVFIEKIYRASRKYANWDLRDTQMFKHGFLWLFNKMYFARFIRTKETKIHITENTYVYNHELHISDQLQGKPMEGTNMTTNLHTRMIYTFVMRTIKGAFGSTAS
ncbi:hypothetical protein ACJX0J_013041, partial [Zea mays]